TGPTSFYQFWINCDDAGIEDYLKIYTLLNRDEISEVMTKHRTNPRLRLAQKELARHVTALVHGQKLLKVAEAVTSALLGEKAIGELDDAALAVLRVEIPYVRMKHEAFISDVLTAAGLATSKTMARRLLADNAISINNQKVNREK